MSQLKRARRTLQVKAKMAALPLDLDNAIDVDLFAGGGGASLGLESGLGRTIRLAINHNQAALSMHEANHPYTEHIREDIWLVDPHAVLRGRPLGWLHGSPDCTHHSQAAGGQPRKQEVRSLGWVLLRWAAMGPVVLSAENVKQMRLWGPLIAKRDPATGRVLKATQQVLGDKVKTVYVVADPGEVVPRQQQWLIPDPKRIGQTWRRWVAALQRLGYEVKDFDLAACDFGAATKRRRLFVLARRDGLPIVQPKPTHAYEQAKQRGLQPGEVTADHIDWSIPCPSIFMTAAEAKAQGLKVKRPLADATMKRIATGLVKEVLTKAKPFIVEIANWSRSRVLSVDDPLPVITSYPKGGAFALVAPYMVQANGGFNTTDSHPVTAPCSVITTTGSQQQLIEAFMIHLRRNMDAGDVRVPLPTITAGSQHHAVVTVNLVEAGGSGLTPEQEAGAQRVAAFLIHYYSSGGQWGNPGEPLHTLTTKGRIALVTVTFGDSQHVITDIGMRMLVDKEQYGCQGFPADYIIARGHDGRVFTAAEKTMMVGNSVSPPVIHALARANDPYRYHRLQKVANA